MNSGVHHLHLVSDATGETINNVARACLAQFENVEVVQHFWSLIRTRKQLDMVMENIRTSRGMVMYTFVHEDMRRTLVDFCRKNEIPAIPVLDPIMNAMASFLGVASSHDPGRQHVMDEDYFARIDAMSFALAQDDGNKVEHISDADVLLLGVSRTSKTPTCIYLANRGIRAANIPLVPELELPVDLEPFMEQKKPLIVGLTRDPESLVETRRSRLQFLHQDEETSYVDLEKVREEVVNARRLFARLGCSVIDVTRRSIEETAAEIMILLKKAARERA